MASLRPLRFSLALLASAFVAACGQGSAQPAGGMPPAEVAVVTVKPGEVGLVTELPGRTEASRTAQVRARAAGIVLKRLFREGSDVRHVRAPEAALAPEDQGFVGHGDPPPWGAPGRA